LPLGITRALVGSAADSLLRAPPAAGARAAPGVLGGPAEIADPTELAHHLVDAHGPPRPELEVIAAPGHAELALDRGALFFQGQAARCVRVGGEEQDDVPPRGRPCPVWLPRGSTGWRTARSATTA
jgi:hypothetical protein